jgi:hypothetical protein
MHTGGCNMSPLINLMVLGAEAVVVLIMTLSRFLIAWLYAHASCSCSLHLIFLILVIAAVNMDIARVAFKDALGHIGFAVPERNACIRESGCTNIAMLGILPTEQIRQICKRLRTRAADPVPITYNHASSTGGRG